MGTATGNTPKQSTGYVENLYVKKPRGTTDISCLQDEKLLQDCNFLRSTFILQHRVLYFLPALIFFTAD